MSYNKPLSFWENDAWLDHLDVVIIGGGIVGMNAALRLVDHSPQLNIAILEQSSLGTGASTRNAGFACYGSPSEIISDLENMTKREVFSLVDKRVQGLRELRKLVGDEHMDYMSHGGYEVFLDDTELEKHIDLLADINKELTEIDPKLQFYQNKDGRSLRNISGIIANDWEGQLHPGKMVQRLRQLCLIKNIHVLTNLKVTRIHEGSKYTLECGDIKIQSAQVIIATNGYAQRLIQRAAPEPGRNLVLLTSEIPNLKLRGCYHYDQGYVYFRNVGNRILIGGGRNIDLENESTDQFGLNEKIRTYLLEIMDRHILVTGTYEIETSWSGILGFNKTKTPRIESISPGLFVAVGLGGMGVAIGTTVGQEVADLLLQS